MKKYFFTLIIISFSIAYPQNQKLIDYLKTIPDFDFERFYADVENLFREKGWIENEKSF